MNVRAWLDDAKTKVDTLDAELILANAMGGVDRTYLVAHDRKILSKWQVSLADMSLHLRELGEPLAYVLGYKDFYGRRFDVDYDVLIPRPETEEIINIVKELKPKKVLDVGTGSGCIGITLKCEMPQLKVACSDKSIRALLAAEKNAKRLEADDITLIISDLLDDVYFKPDVLVANLPYLDPDWAWINPDLLRSEPQDALYAADGGTALIKKLIRQCKKRKIPTLVLESDPFQHEEIVEYAEMRDYNLADIRGFIMVFNHKDKVARETSPKKS